MTVQEISRWLKETEAIVSALMQVDGQLAEMRAARAISAKVENKKNLIAVENNLAILEKQYASIEEEMRMRLNVRSVAGAVELLTDVAARLERAQQLYRDWRVAEGAVEFARVAGKLVDQPTDEPGKFTEEQVATILQQSQKEYEIQLMLVERLIPTATSLIIPASSRLT